MFSLLCWGPQRFKYKWNDLSTCCTLVLLLVISSFSKDVEDPSVKSDKQRARQRNSRKVFCPMAEHGCCKPCKPHTQGNQCSACSCIPEHICRYGSENSNEQSHLTLTWVHSTTVSSQVCTGGWGWQVSLMLPLGWEAKRFWAGSEETSWAVPGHADSRACCSPASPWPSSCAWFTQPKQ